MAWSSPWAHEVLRIRELHHMGVTQHTHLPVLQQDHKFRHTTKIRDTVQATRVLAQQTRMSFERQERLIH